MKESDKVEFLKAQFEENDLQMHYFAGNWCPMCIASTPEVMAIANKAEISTDRIAVHSVNPSKSEPREPIKKFDISRVPTLVITHAAGEIGRVTEYTNQSWLDDIYNIIKSRNEG